MKAELERASERGYTRMVQPLLGSGADIRGEAMKAALEIASERGLNRVVRLLLTTDTKIDMSKAIEVASSRGIVVVLERLLERDAEIESETIEAAMQVASERCSAEILQLQLQYETRRGSREE